MKIFLAAAGLILLLFTCSVFQSPACPYNYTQVPVFSFPTNAFWYQKIATNAQIDPDSAGIVSLMRSQQNSGEPYLVTGCFTVYYCDAKTPRYPVPIVSAGYKKKGLKSVPIPDYTRTTRETDGHVVFIDTANRLSYEFWQFRLQEGRWVAGNSAIFNLDGNGVNPYISARASGFSLLGGAIWPQEILNRNIPHALVVSFKNTKKGGPVAPASWSDGWSDDRYALPVGALIQLDPDLDIASLGADPYQQAVMKALQDYGAYVCDSGGFGIMAVDPRSYSEDPYTSIPGYHASWGSIDISKIPVDKFRVIRMGPQLPMTNGIAYEFLYY